MLTRKNKFYFIIAFIFFMTDASFGCSPWSDPDCIPEPQPRPCPNPWSNPECGGVVKPVQRPVHDQKVHRNAALIKNRGTGVTLSTFLASR